MRFGLTKEQAISKLTKETAEIIGAPNIGQIKKDYKASLVVWSGDPFEITSYPKLVVGEGKIVHQE
ncbi:MAG: amidohydrolase family protein [Thermoprotei archaeon]